MVASMLPFFVGLLIFIVMANSKTLQIKDDAENQLEIYVNTNNEIYMHVGNFDDSMLCGHICLNKEDAQALIKELKSLINELD